MNKGLLSSSVAALLHVLASSGSSGCAGDSPAGRGQSRPDAGAVVDAPGFDSGSGSVPGPKKCSDTEHLEGDQCIANLRSCTIANGVGEETWSGEKFGNCVLQSCNAGYQRTAAVCTVSLVGRFKTPCGLEAEDGLDEIWTNDFIDDINHVLTGEVYGSNNGACGGVLHRTVRHIGTYKRIKVSASVPGAVEIDFTNPTLEVTLRSQQAVSNSNAAAECGKADWALNIPYKFPRAACTSNPALVKTINKVVGNSLYVGNFKGPKDASGRPQTLNEDPTRIGKRVP